MTIRRGDGGSPATAMCRRVMPSTRALGYCRADACSTRPGAAAGSGQLAAAQCGSHRLDELHLLTPLRILLILLTAFIVTCSSRRLVKRLLRAQVRRSPAATRSAPRRAPGRWPTCCARRLLGIVWAAAVITIISELGINIGAFVATATIVGGAVAFGAQTLVRDVIAGFFVLAEDQYGVGDRSTSGWPPAWSSGSRCAASACATRTGRSGTCPTAASPGSATCRR